MDTHEVSFPVVFGVMNKEPKEDNGFTGRSRQLVVFIWGTQSFSTDLLKDEVILRARFGCSAEHQQGTIFGNNMMTFHGKLFWTVTHYSNVVSDAVA